MGEDTGSAHAMHRLHRIIYTRTQIKAYTANLKTCIQPALLTRHWDMLLWQLLTWVHPTLCTSAMHTAVNVFIRKPSFPKDLNMTSVPVQMYLQRRTGQKRFHCIRASRRYRHEVPNNASSPAQASARLTSEETMLFYCYISSQAPAIRNSSSSRGISAATMSAVEHSSTITLNSAARCMAQCFTNP